MIFNINIVISKLLIILSMYSLNVPSLSLEKKAKKQKKETKEKHRDDRVLDDSISRENSLERCTPTGGEGMRNQALYTCTFPHLLIQAPRNVEISGL